ncbi:hypothetical protein [Sphingomonas abaci]|uniref:Holin n=1 Tax=Sphingomonas abaci TaxID=237611 RepID=A0A7W7AKT5_9SPHN|nr:hypothetical protein [Sphingomonas abaci]MBB4618015.1 hypothetical protein [Sphingomonas abaci]
MDKLLHEIGAALLAWMLGLVPAALGALISLVFEPDVTWSRRFAQLAVGVTVSYFVTNATAALWPWPPLDPYVRQAIGFVVGMVAFRATPKFITGAEETIGRAPGQLLDRVLAVLPGRKDAK